MMIKNKYEIYQEIRKNWNSLKKKIAGLEDV